MSTTGITTTADVLARLAAGEELRNRGTGWWIGPARQPYKAHNPVLVATEVVQELEGSGRIKIKVPGTSAIAELVSTAN